MSAAAAADGWWPLVVLCVELLTCVPVVPLFVPFVVPLVVLFGSMRRDWPRLRCMVGAAGLKTTWKMEEGTVNDYRATEG